MQLLVEAVLSRVGPVSWGRLRYLLCAMVVEEGGESMERVMGVVEGGLRWLAREGVVRELGEEAVIYGEAESVVVLEAWIPDPPWDFFIRKPN